MNDGKANYIIGRNLTHVWGEALSLIVNQGRREIQPLIVTVNDIKDNTPGEDFEIRQELDDLLVNKNKFQSHTVANTIFPKSLWSQNHSRDLLYKRFRDIFPQILKYDNVGKRYGRYFDRMIDYRANGKKINQLEYIISTRTEKKNMRRSALQVCIIDPTIDHTDQRMRGFPCLQQIAFAPLSGGGMSITGFYPYQYVFDRAYGNYLGLCWLGHFVAHELGLKLKEMTCIAGIAALGGIKKTDNNIKHIANLIKKRNRRD